MTSNFDLKTNAAYLVAIEWDGLQPPSRWYRRLSGFGLRVSGSKDLSPVERRASSGSYAGENVGAVIYQEGAIMVSSYSLARTLAIYAKEEGATNVRIASLEVLDALERNQKDTQIVNRIESVFGRRGRPPASHKWAVTCLECMTITAQEAPTAVNCGHCGGLRINARKGAPVTYADPGGDLFTAWLRLRFSGAHWEPAEIGENGQEAPALEFCNYDDKDAVKALEGSAVLAQIETMDRATAFLFLDAIYVNLSHYTKEERIEKRIRAAVEYYRLGGETNINIDEGQAPDLLMAAGPLAGQYVAASLISIMAAGA